MNPIFISIYTLAGIGLCVRIGYISKMKGFFESLGLGCLLALCAFFLFGIFGEIMSVILSIERYKITGFGVEFLSYVIFWPFLFMIGILFGGRNL